MRFLLLKSIRYLKTNTNSPQNLPKYQGQGNICKLIVGGQKYPGQKYIKIPQAMKSIYQYP